MLGVLHTDHGRNLVMFTNSQRSTLWNSKYSALFNVTEDGKLRVEYTNMEKGRELAREQVLNMENEKNARERDVEHVAGEIDRICRELPGIEEDEDYEEMQEELMRQLAVQRQHHKCLRRIDRTFETHVTFTPEKTQQVLEPHMLSRFFVTNELVFWCPGCTGQQCKMQGTQEEADKAQELKVQPMEDVMECHLASGFGTPRKLHYLSLQAGGRIPPEKKHDDGSEFFQSYQDTKNPGHLQEAAMLGHPEAGYRWACWWKSRSLRVTEKWLQIAANHPEAHPDASYEYGQLTGEERYFFAGITHGHVGCHLALGRLYLHDRKVEHARKLLDFAANKGCAPAYSLLGKSYLQENQTLALAYLRQASQRYGDADATYLLAKATGDAKLLRTAVGQGSGDARDYLALQLPLEEALKLCQDSKTPRAQTIRGIQVFLSGGGGHNYWVNNEDPVAAYMMARTPPINLDLLDNALNIGDALMLKAQQYMDVQKYRDAGSLYERCANDTSLQWLQWDIVDMQYQPVNRRPQAKLKYGNALMIGVAQGAYQAGPHWIREAAEAGVKEAMHKMAEILEVGWGIEKNPEESQMWLLRALEKSN